MIPVSSLGKLIILWLLDSFIRESGWFGANPIRLTIVRTKQWKYCLVPGRQMLIVLNGHTKGVNVFS